MTEATDRFRDHFPSLAGRVYLNAASEGPMPAAAVAEAERVARLKAEPWSIGSDLYYEAPAAVRERLERILGAPRGSVALVPGTSAGIGLAAERLPIRLGEEVLLLEAQFPSNVFPWRAVRARGASLRFAPRPFGTDPTSAIIAAISPRTRIIAIDWVNFVDGAVAELDKVGEACRARGIFLVVDAAQGLGALSIDLSKVPISLLAAPAHKWLLGPAGVGLVYVAPDLLEMVQDWNAGWINLAARSGFRNLLRLDGGPADDATRLEKGTPPYGLLAPWRVSLDLLGRLDAGRAERRILSLAERAARGLLALSPSPGRDGGLNLRSPRSPARASGIVSFDAGGRTAALYRALAAENITVALREGMIRLSPHLYNTEDEVDTLLESCRRFLH